MKFSNKISQSVGNKVLNIDEITKKDQLPQTIEDLNQRRTYSENIVKKKALLSSGSTLVPVPGFDFGVDV
ncbi:DUF697 domain-containing protein, partial [Staphylococcus felis]|nr:DUF697 domain-containing protein [Staphylococcus felis]